MRKILRIAIWLTLLGGTATAQPQVSQVEIFCRGTLAGADAVLSGVRYQHIYDSTGGVQVKFSGRVNAGGIDGTIAYDGYARAELRGLIQSPTGTYSISVVENVGAGRMTIYDGQASLGAPRTFGEFGCTWR